MKSNELKNSSSRYGLIAIGFHWIIAFVVISTIGIGKYLDTLEFTDPEYNPIYFTHISIGVTIFFLTLLRLVWRLKNNVPEPPSKSSKLEVLLSKITHFGFYFMLIIIPLSGWSLSATVSEKPWTTIYGIIPWPQMPWVYAQADRITLMGPLHNLHEFLVHILIGLLLLHLAGVLKHKYLAKRSILKRMLPEKRKTDLGSND